MPHKQSVSIVMPVRNEKRYIKQCLDSILDQDYSAIKEIIISDGQSDDGTIDFLDEYKRRDSRIRLLTNHYKIQTIALNQCIRSATSDIIVRIDAHAFYPKEYVSSCIQCLLETKAANVGGPCRNKEREGFIPSLINIVHESPFGLGASKFRRTRYKGFVDSVWPGVFWRRVFSEVGYFNESLVRTEDMEFNRRLRDRGYTIYLTPEIEVYYYARDNISDLLKQNFFNGWGVMQNIFVTGKITALRHLVPLAFVSFLIISGSLIFFFPQARPILIIGIGVYALANILFSLQEAFKKGIKYLFSLPLMFLLLHLTYGLGSICALCFYLLHRRNN